MSYYNIMLVDDEIELRQGIIKKIDWQALGFTVVGDAENGQDALEKLETLRPDVIISDIKMPFMDGITFGQRLAQLMPDVKLIILSGFDDFEYAKEAIKINVEDYILKPVNAVELTNILTTLKQKMDFQRESKRDVQKLRQYYIESLPLLRQQFLLSLFERPGARSKLLSYAKSYDMELEGGQLLPVILHPDGQDNLKEFAAISVKKLLEEQKDLPIFYNTLYFDEVLCLFVLKEGRNIYEFVQRMQQLCESSARLLDISLTAGIGYLCHDVGGIHGAYSAAREAISYRSAIGSGRAIYIDDIEPGGNGGYDKTVEQALLAAIKLDGEEEIKPLAYSLASHLVDSKESPQQCELLLMGFLAELFKLLQSAGAEYGEIFSPTWLRGELFQSFSTAKALGDFLTSLCIRVNAQLKKERLSSSKGLIDRALSYMQGEFANPDLSAEHMCDYLHISSAYFSTLFKKETGSSFVSYLTRLRMEAAVDLLKTTDDKTYIISEKVGFPDANYFSYVFKKQYQVSPSKFRSTLGEPS